MHNEENQDTQTTDTVYAKLAKVAAELAKAGIGKDEENKHSNYSFRGIDAVCDAVGPLLAKNGLVLVSSYSDRDCQERKNPNGKTFFWTTLQGQFTFISADDGSQVTVGPFYGESADYSDKSTGQAESYAYRNALIKTFCIPVNGTAENTDAKTPELSETTAEPAQRTASTPRSRPSRAQQKTDRQTVSDLFKRLVEDIPPPQKRAAVAAVATHMLGKPYADSTPEDITRLIRDLRKAFAEKTNLNLLVDAGVIEPVA